MFSKIKALFATSVQTVEHDVEAIIASFTSTVQKLEDAAASKLAEAKHLTNVASEFEKDADAAHAASEKATKVAEQIKALVS